MKRVWLLALVLGLLAGCESDPTRPPPNVTEDDRVKTLVDLGTGYMRNGDYARAKENLNRAINIDSNSALAHNMLAIVFQLEQEYELAEEHFRKALRSNPNSTRVRNNYGAFLFERERYREAIEQLNRAKEDRYYEKRPTVFENLGISYLRVGEKEKAEKAFDRAVALNPDQPRALLELANIRFEDQQYVPARQLYRRYQQVAGQNAKSLWLCIRLSRVFENDDEEASCALALRNMYPASREYEQYQESLSR